MFRRVLIAGTVFLATACVPITPEPTGPCISDERALLIGETVETEPSYALPGYIDLVKVESRLREHVLTVVLHLRDIPEELTFYREGTGNTHAEYSWSVLVSGNGDEVSWRNQDERTMRFRHRIMTTHFVRNEESNAPRTGPIADIANTEVWVLKRDDESEEAGPWSIKPLWEASLDVSHEQNSLTMSGYIPHISRDSLLVFETHDYLNGYDRIGCDPGRDSVQKSSLPETYSGDQHASSAKADLNDLASILARMDGAESAVEYTGLLQEFSDCFLSNLSASERAEGLSDESGLSITPAQITAVTLFQAGVFAIVGQFERAQDVDRSENPPDAVNMFELLEGGLTVCEKHQ